MIVTDTNVIAYLLLPGVHTPLAEAVFDKDSHWIAPFLWQSEFRNILALYLRQKEITFDQARAVMTKAERMLRRQTHLVNSDDVLNLVMSSACSAYDCEFVALAKRFNIPLVTADKKVLREFPETAVSLEQFSRI